jgi:hypothetical protein
VAHLALLVTIGFGAAVANAAPAFGPPVDVAAGERAADTPSATYDSAGTAEIGWATSAGTTFSLAAARRPLRGGFGPAPTIAQSTRELTGPVLASSPDGQLVAAAWVALDESERGRVWASMLGPGGAVVQAVPVSGAEDDASEPAIAIGADGRVVVAWNIVDADDNDHVQAAHGTLDAPMTIRNVSVGESSASQPDIAFDAAGILQIAFTTFDADFVGRIKVAPETLAGTFGPSRFLSATGVDASEPSIALAPGGGLAVAWGALSVTETESVEVGVELVPGVPFPAATVPGGGESTSGRLAVDPATGALTIAWIRTLDGASSALVANRAVGGEIEAPVVVSGGDEVAELDLAYSAAGDGVVAWLRNFGTEEDPAGDIRAALYDAPRSATPPPPPPPPPPLPPPPPPPPPALARPALTLTNFAVDPACIRYGAPFTGPRKPLSFSFVLSEAASLRLEILRRLNSGVQRRCPAVRVHGAAGRLGPPVVVDIAPGAGPGATSVGPAGEVVAASAQATRLSRLTTTQRVKSGRRRIVLRQAPTTLVPGTYIARATASTADGRRSATLMVKFWVLR